MKKLAILCTVILLVLLPATLVVGCQQEAEVSPPPTEEEPPPEEVPPPPEETAKAEFQVDSVEIASVAVVEGDPVTVSAIVTNIGETDGVYTAVLKINRVEDSREDVNINAGASETVTFELLGGTIGTYDLDVGGQTASFRVIGEVCLGQSLVSLQDFNGLIVACEPQDLEATYSGQVEAYRIKYLSDGLEVVGFVVKPKENDVTYPILIYNRGGNREFGKIEDLTYLSYLSANGYVVVASQYRGNDGGQGSEEFGGSDVNDVLNLIPLAESLPFATPEKIMMLGYSRGGMMTYIAITMTDKIKAAAVVGGVTDLIQMYNEREEEMKQVCIELIGGTPEEKEAEYQKRSAYFWPEKIDTPVLILHGGDDWRVDVSQAEKLAEKLEGLGKTFKLKVYPGGDHSLDNNRPDRNSRIFEWFEKYLD
jgi:dienelactone hydrolase